MWQREDKHWSVETCISPRKYEWEVWYEAYQNASTIDDRISLLYTCPASMEEGILFLLKEAEGFNAKADFFLEENLRSGSYHPTVYTFFGTFKNVGEARREIPRTAFSRLLKYFFKNTQERAHEPPSWYKHVVKEEVLGAVLHFFRINEDGNFTNWPDEFEQRGKHQIKVVSEFLLALVNLGWKLPTNAPRSREVQELFMSHRREFIEILCGLGSLDELLHFDDVGEEELKVVTQLALGKELWLPDEYGRDRPRSRLPKSVEEAAYGGSQAGKIAIILRENVDFDKHYKKLSEAYRQHEEAERQLTRLRSSEK